MSIGRLVFYVSMTVLFLAMAGIPIKSASPVVTLGQDDLIAGRNINMVSGTKLPLGDPWLQRQNEPSMVVTSRNSMHLFAAANDYRTIDMPDPIKDEVRGIPGVSAIRDAWIGTFFSLNGGESFYTMLLPGFPQDTSIEGAASPIHGFDTACDPIVRAAEKGRLYLSGIAFNRSQNAGSVFVARYVDFNDREKVKEETDPDSGYKRYVGPIRYIDTRLVDAGNPGQFIDMSNMAVDIPRSPEQPGNVYLAYTVFLGNSDINVRSRIVFVRSTDGGLTWSKQIKLTESQHIIQRPVIVIDPSDPTGKTIYVVFRRFSHGTIPDGIVLVKSIDGGLTFSKPADVATFLNPYYPFDQWTKGDGTTTSITSFRTNSYPTMAVDGDGIAYVAWARRNGQEGHARIVISYSTDHAVTWSAPQIVDSIYTGDGHQFMPSMTCAGGKITLIWYDQRDDIALHHPNTKFIEDIWGKHRHTIDVRAAEAPAGVLPLIFSDSIPVSRYLFFMQLDEKGEPYMEGAYPKLWQGEFNYACLPLFWLGTKPFHGDYIEVISSPQILPPPATPSNAWLFNTSPSEPTVSHGVWTDNRNVRPPAGSLWGDWVTYNPPTSTQDGDFAQLNPCNNKDTTGMRNQNIYTANLNHGVIVGSPGNTKQLDIQRSFVVFVKDTIGIIDENNIQNRSFQLILDEIGGANASFDQSSGSVKSLIISVPPYSSVSSTVYVEPSGNHNGFAPVIVNVMEGSNLVGRVYLNPDSTNNPILDPDGNNWIQERHNPKMSNPKIWKYDVGNQNEPNAKFLSPRGQNPRGQNSGYINPRGQNSGVMNPRGQNSGAMNPRGQNESIVNSEMYNPRGQNFSVANTALTDMTWTVSNDGNTTSAYSFNIASNNADYLNQLFDDKYLIAQVLVYKVHKTPIDNECQLFQTHADELMVNVVNPRGQNPRGQNYAPGSVNFTTRVMNATTQQGDDSQDITFYLAPGEEAEVTLRVYDPDITDEVDIDTVIVDQVAGETAAEAANTGETAPSWDTQPNLPWVNPLPAIVASPISMSFSASDFQSLYLSLSGLYEGESLEYTISIDLPDGQNWLTVDPHPQIPDPGPGTLTEDPLEHLVTVTAPGTSGSYTGSIWVHVPSAANNPLRIPVYLTVGAAYAPEIDVFYEYADNTVNIGDGGTLDFGTKYLGSTSEIATFEINNIGSGNLILGGRPIITIYGPDANQFRVAQQPTSPVPPGNSMTFALQFAPTSVGQKTAMISIMNNDFDENPFDIVLRGKCPLPELVAYYPFNGNADDESGHGNHGTVNGAVLTADRFGNLNRAYQFDGVNDGIVVENSDSLDITHSITITAWIKPNAGRTAGEYIVQKRELTQGGFVYSLDIWPGTVRSLYRYQGGGTATRDAEGSTSIVADQWQHVAATWDGSTITVYYNGQPDGSAPFTDGPIMTSIGNLEIGHYTGGWTYFSGSIDDIRIYNVALSPAEIQQLYAQEAAGIPGLVACYTFNGNADDVSGNGHHGIVYGNPTYSEDRNGSAGGAMNFDGVNDYVELPDESSFDLTEMTIMAIVKVPDYSRNNYIISKGSTNGGNFNLHVNSSQVGNPGKAGYVHQVQVGNWSHLVTQNAVQTDQFLHITVTLDGKHFNSYLNGQKEWGPVDYSSYPPILNDENAAIGSAMYGVTQYFFIGTIDEIRVYNRALSASEVQTLYAAQTGCISNASGGGGWTNIIPVNQVGQSFLSNGSLILNVDVNITTGNQGNGDDTITLKILAPGGEVLKQVAKYVIDGFDGWLNFDIPEGLNVAPGTTLRIQLEDTGKITFGWRYAGNTYLNGTYWFNGSPNPNYDFFFRVNCR